MNRLERLIIDSPPMQRLRRVRQLGTTHLVYPSGTHSRFSHAIGTLRSAQDLIDAVVQGRTGPRHGPDLLDEWASAAEPVTRRLQDGTEVAARELDYRVAEATVLARLGGLMHDLCHVPLGHTIEDDLEVLDPHDGNAERFERLWAQMDPDARDAIEAADNDLAGELRMLILSKAKQSKPAEMSQYPFVADIVGNTICADLMDYLRRDHKMTGLPMAVGHRFMNDFYVMGSSHPHFAKRMVVRVTRDGILRADVVTELIKYLRFRYELTERVLTHHAKLAADAMIGKLLEMWHDQTWLDQAADQPDFASLIARAAGDVDRAQHLIAQKYPAKVDSPHTLPADAPLTKTNKAVADLESTVRQTLDLEFTRRSDDGLLEHLEASAADHKGDARWSAIGGLAKAVLNRDLYAMIGRTPVEAVPQAVLKYGKFGSAAARRSLERRAAKVAGLADGWKVVLWIPSPGMRLKVAEVLVDTGDQVNQLAAVSSQGEDIVQQHRNLWAISVFVHREARPTPADSRAADVVLSFLHDELSVPLKRWDGRPVRPLRVLAVDRVSDHAILTRIERAKLMELQPAARGGTGSFSDLLASTWQLAVQVRPHLTRQVPPGL